LGGPGNTNPDARTKINGPILFMEPPKFLILPQHPPPAEGKLKTGWRRTAPPSPLEVIEEVKNSPCNSSRWAIVPTLVAG
jgi:hypothetical protein